MMPEERNKIKRRTLTEDFNTMRDMLAEIELKILGVDLERQQTFIQPIKNFIFEAWSDACNKEDAFLYPKINQ